MDWIYIVTGEGTYTPVEGAEVRRMLAEGQLSPETYFWIEGMPDWLPLHHLPPLPEPEPAPPPAPAPVPAMESPQPAAILRAKPQPIEPQPPLSESAPQKPTYVAPGHAYIQPNSNRLKSTYPIALGRRVANDPEPPLAPEATGPTVALPRRTATQPQWASAPVTPQPQRVASTPTRHANNPYLPAHPAPAAPPKPTAAPVELEAAAPEASTSAAPPATLQYFAREDLEPMTRIVLGMVVLCLLSALIYLYFNLKHYKLLMGTHTFDDEDLSLAKLGFLFEGCAYLFAFASLPFLIWVHRVVENTHGFIPGVRFATGWAIFYFFIPVLNLFRPCQVMQDTWKISTRPLGWAGRRPSVVVGAWGILWAAHVILSVVALKWGTLNPAAEDSITAININLAYSANYVGLCLLTALMVYMITRKQKRLVRLD